MLDETNLKNKDKTMIKKLSIFIILYIVSNFYKIAAKCYKMYSKKE